MSKNIVRTLMSIITSCIFAAAPLRASTAIYSVEQFDVPSVLLPGQTVMGTMRIHVVEDADPPFDRPGLVLKSLVSPQRMLRIPKADITPWKIENLNQNDYKDVSFKIVVPSDFPPGPAILNVQIFRKLDGPPEVWEPALVKNDESPEKTSTGFVRNVSIEGAVSAWPKDRYIVGATAHWNVHKAVRDIPEKIDAQAEVKELRKHNIDFILGKEHAPGASPEELPSVVGTYAHTEALAAGAELANSSATYFADPLVVDAMVTKGIMLAALNRGNSSLFAITGLDEPWGAKNIILGKTSIQKQGLRERVYQDVHANFGNGEIVAPASETDTNPLAWIAFHRWYDNQFQTLQSRLYRGIKQVDPNRAVLGHNFFFLRCVPTWDYAEMAKSFDACMLDPYDQKIAKEEPLRALYHVGFSTKLVADLTGKPTLSAPGFMEYWKGYPTGEKCFDLANQAMRCGAAGLMYYLIDWGPYRYLRYPAEQPERWGVLMKISDALHKMKPLAFPNTKTLVLFPTDTYAAENETRANEIYTAHAVIGEHAHIWYRFISDRQIGREEGGLSDAAILYVPKAYYIESKVAERILQFVENGGTLVLGDTDCFSQTPLGKPIDPNLRSALVPVENRSSIETWPAEGDIPSIHVIAVGKGKIIYPESPLFVLKNSQSKALVNLVKRMQDVALADSSSDIWQFSLPREQILGR